MKKCSKNDVFCPDIYFFDCYAEEFDYLKSCAFLTKYINYFEP